MRDLALREKDKRSGRKKGDLGEKRKEAKDGKGGNGVEMSKVVVPFLEHDVPPRERGMRRLPRAVLPQSKSKSNTENQPRP